MRIVESAIAYTIPRRRCPLDTEILGATERVNSTEQTYACRFSRQDTISSQICKQGQWASPQETSMGTSPKRALVCQYPRNWPAPFARACSSDDGQGGSMLDGRCANRAFWLEQTPELMCAIMIIKTLARFCAQSDNTYEWATVAATTTDKFYAIPRC